MQPTANTPRMPLVKCLAPFAAGIFFAASHTLPTGLLLGGFVLCGIAALLLRSSVYTLAALFLFGFSTAQLRNTHPDVPQGLFTHFEATLLEPPALRTGYSSTPAQINAWRNPETGHWHASAAKVTLWCDSTLLPAAGDRIRFAGKIRPFSVKYPEYAALMIRRGYAGTANLNRRNLLQRDSLRSSNLHLRAIERMNRLRLNDASQGLCNAMAAGDRSRLTPELRAAYARSGTSHLLAVSGLHVGIVFALVNLLLWGLPALMPRRGHLVRNVAAITLVWLYAAVAGFSPSVIRAALMFSALQFSLASTSAYSGINILAGTAFVMLAANPAYLFDISFQLSFIAVAAILAWAVPLCRRLRSGRRWIDLPVDAVVVSLVSTVATAPLVCHTFGVVSLAGLVINPIVVLLAGVIVAGSVGWMLVPFEIVRTPFALLLETTAGLQNWIVTATANQAWAAVEYSLSAPVTAICYFVFVVVTVVLHRRNPKKRVSLPR